MLYNPAATGIGSDWNIFALHRDQWSGFTGSPVTNTFTIDGPVKSKKIGLGLNVYSDQIGITSRTGAYANYSYKVSFNKENHLYLGLSTGILINTIDFTKLKTKESNDVVPSGTQTAFDASFGAIYQFRNLQVGFSTPQLIGNTLTYSGQGDNKNYYTLNRHYLGSIKYVVDVVKEKGISAYPLILVRSSQGAPLQYDVNAVLDWRNTAWAAVAYKSSGSVTANLGLRFYGVSIGYAYDVANGPVGSVAGSTSEILLGYSLE